MKYNQYMASPVGVAADCFIVLIFKITIYWFGVGSGDLTCHIISIPREGI